MGVELLCAIRSTKVLTLQQNWQYRHWFEGLYQSFHGMSVSFSTAGQGVHVIGDVLVSHEEPQIVESCYRLVTI
jgi:hypothetical protein